MPMVKVEVWVAVDEDGDAVADTDKGTAMDNAGATVVRLIKVELDIELPEPTVVRATVPANAGEAVARVEG